MATQWGHQKPCLLEFEELNYSQGLRLDNRLEADLVRYAEHMSVRDLRKEYARSLRWNTKQNREIRRLLAALSIIADGDDEWASDFADKALNTDWDLS